MPRFSRRLQTILLAGTALTLVAVGSPMEAMAATDTYDGAGSTTSNGNFNLGSNYDTGNAPGAADTAVFGNSAAVTKTSAITFANTSNPLNTLLFNGGVSYTFLEGNAVSFNIGTLTNSSTANQTFDLTGTGSTLTIGTLTNTSTGGESFNTTNGNLTFSGSVSIGNSSLIVNGNAATIMGAYSSAGGTLDLSQTTGTNIIGSISDTSGGSEKIMLGGTGSNLSVGGAGSTTTYDGVISGAGSNFALTGGTLTLTQAVTYTGSTTITGGTLVAGSANTLAQSSGVSFTNNGSFNFNGFSQTLNNLSGDSTSTLALGANSLTVDGSGSSTFAGVISGSGSVTYGGTGTLSLTGTNTYTGGSVINSGGTLNVTTASLPINNGVADAGTLQFTNTGTGTYSGAISGAGAVQVLGGTVTLSGANNYTGALTINNAATLAGVTNASDLGSAITFGGAGGTIQTSAGTTISNNITLTGNGTVDTNGNADTLSGVVSGAGRLILSSSTGTGSVSVSGANTFTGGAFINSNTTATYANVAALGTGTVNVNGPAAVVNLNGFSPTINGLNGNNAGSVLAGASTLTLAGSGAYTYAGTITGTGALIKNGTGTQALSGATGYTGAVTINAGTINAGNNASLGSGIVTFNGGALGASAAGITIGNAATLAAGGGTLTSLGNSYTYSGALTGTGALNTAGTHTVTLTNAGNAYSGGTNANGGTLALGVDNAIAAGTLAVGNAGTVALGTFNQTVTALTGSGAVTTTGGALTVASGTFSGVYSGAGNLIKNTAGTLTLSGANTYSGVTNVNAGTLALGASNAAGPAGLAIASGATFAMNGFDQEASALSGSGAITSTGGTLTADAGTFTGTVSSTGALIKSTAGSLTLNNASSFASTTVSAGTLQVGDTPGSAAMLTSPVTVASGGTLMGYGTIVGALTNNGTVNPGTAIGALTVNGNYTQAQNSVLTIRVTPTSNSVLAVNGTAALNGTLSIVNDPGSYALGKQYTVLTANNGITGQFATATATSTGTFFTETYLPNAVELTVTSPEAIFAAPPPGATSTPNTSNVDGAIKSILPGVAPSSAFAEGLVNIFGPSLADAPRALVAGALGELRADIGTIDLANLTSFQNFIVERMNECQGLTTTRMAMTGLPGTFDVPVGRTDESMFGPCSGSNPTRADQASLWVHGYGVLGETGGESGFSEFQYRTGGIVGGIDTKVAPGVLIGAAVAYEHTDFNLSGDNGENNIDTYRATLYGSAKLNPIPMVFDAAVGYAFNDYHDSDYLPLASGTGYQQTSRHDGDELSAEAGLSHAFSVPQGLTSGKLTLVPRIGVEYDNIHQNRYATSGSPVAGLDFDTNGTNLNALRSLAGIRADLTLMTKNGTALTPEIRAAYLHDFMATNVALSESFTGAPAAGFRISGVHPGRDAALLGAGMTAAFNPNLSATLSYDADIREHELDHTVQAGVKYNW